MPIGFSYKGKHSYRDFGALLQSKSRPILPQKRQKYVDLPNRDGSPNLAAVNDYRRAMYDNRTFTVALLIRADEIVELETKISRVAEWLVGNGALIFDDMPNVQWDATVDSAVDYAPERYGKKAILTVSFTVQPFSQALFSVGTGVYLGEATPLGASITLGAVDNYDVIEGVGGSIKINNVGTAWARPLVRVTRASGAAVRSWRMSLGGRTLRIAADDVISNTGWEVDLDTYNVYRLTGTGREINAGALEGSFFELPPGESWLAFVFSEFGEYHIKLIYRPQYIYNYIGGEG